ncbi:CKLF-like MARVEL transmembrane domain-containing protein 7 isoform X2 [Opisthocomus hoazin]
MCDLVMILFFYMIHIFRIYRKLTCVSWPLAEFLHYLIGTILLLIASIVAASKSYNLTGLVAGSIFGFVATILCVLSMWSSYKVSCITQSTILVPDSTAEEGEQGAGGPGPAVCVKDLLSQRLILHGSSGETPSSSAPIEAMLRGIAATEDKATSPAVSVSSEGNKQPKPPGYTETCSQVFSFRGKDALKSFFPRA